MFFYNKKNKYVWAAGIIAVIFIFNLIIAPIMPVIKIYAEDAAPNLSENSLKVGSGGTSSDVGLVRKYFDNVVSDDYYMSFYYMYPSGVNMDTFYVWSSLLKNNTKYVVTRLIQKNSTLTAEVGAGGGNKVLDISIDADTWHHILIHVKSDSTFEIFINQVKALIGDSYAQPIIDTKVVESIVFGDTSAKAYSGIGYFDNFKIYTVDEILFEDDFNGGSLEGWNPSGTGTGLADPPVNCPLAELDNIKIATEITSIMTGNTAQLKVWGMLADGTPDNLNNIIISYESSDDTVVKIEKSDGNMATVRAVSSGTAVITAKAVIDNVEKEATITFTVTDEPKIYKILLEVEDTKLFVGERAQISVKGILTDESSVTLKPGEIEISTDSPETLGIEVEEESIYLTGLNKGNARVNVKYSGFEETIDIDVPELDSISISSSKALLILNEDEYARISLVGHGSNGSTKSLDMDEVIIESDNIEIISIERLENEVRAIPKGKGKSSVRAEITFNNIKYTASAPFLVSDSIYNAEIVNGGFEDVIDGKPAFWKDYNADNVMSSSEIVYEGNHSVKMIDTSNVSNQMMRSLPIVAEAGKEYMASIYSYNEAGVSELYLEFWDADDNRINEATVTIMNSSLKVWKKIEVHNKAPEGTVAATLLLVQHKKNVGTAYFDNAEFGLIPEKPAIVPAEPDEINNGFEDVVDGKPALWTGFSEANVQSSTDKVYEGMYSVKMTDPSSEANQLLRSIPIKAEPGNEYIGSVYSYNEAGVSELYIEFWDKDGKRLAGSTGENPTLREWKRIEVHGEAPEGTAYATLLLVQHVKNVGTAYFDKVEFKLRDEGIVKEFPLKVQGYPRLYFTKDDIDSLKTRANDISATNIGKSYKDIWQAVDTLARDFLAEESFTIPYYGNYNVTYPLPPVQPEPMGPPPGFTSGDYPYWTAMSTAIEQRLETLSLAYVITGEEEFGNRAKEYIMSLTEWNSWTERPDVLRTGLDTPHLTLGICAAYDMIYDLFTDEERVKVEGAIEEKGLEPLYKDALAKVDHNIQMLRAVALGSGGALLLGKSENANKYLSRATDYYKWYLDERISSGRQEGMMYTDYALENLIRAIDQITRVTGKADLINHPFLNDFIIRWVTYFLAPGGKGLPNFSDSHPTSYFFITMNVLSNWLDNGYAGWYISEGRPNASAMEQFLYYNSQSEITPPYDLPDSVVLDEIGWASLRTGWESEDTMLAFQSNNSNFGHNHYDQNSFQIANNGVWLATDPGYVDFSPGPINDFTLKMGHNTIYVDGNPQSNKGGGRLIEKLLSPTYDYVIGSAADAYGEPKLNRFDRHIIQVKYKKPYYYVVLDDIEADEPRNYDWILYTGKLDQFTIDNEEAQIGEQVYGNELNIVKGQAQMSVNFVSDEKLPISAKLYQGAETYGPYIKVSNPSAAKQYKFLNVITAGKSNQGIFTEAADLLPPADSSGREYKLVNVAGRTAVFYRGTKPGTDETGSGKDFIIFKFDVPKDGIYDVNINFIKSPAYGIANVYLDNILQDEVYDGYDKEVKVALYNVGERDLIKGEHTIKIEIDGKNEASSNYFIGISSIQLIPKDQSGENEEFKVNTSLIKGENVIGAKVKRNDSNDELDTVLFKNGEGASYTINGIESDAQQLTLSSNDKAKVVKACSMVDGRSVKYDGRTIFTSDEKLDLSINYQDANDIKGTAILKESSEIGIYTGFKPEVAVNGSLYDTSKYEYESSTGIVYINLASGKSEISLKISNEDLFRVGNVKFTDFVGKEISSLIGGTDIKASVEITNNNNRTESAVIIVALFDKDNRLVNYSTVSQQIGSNAIITLEAGFRLPANVQGHKIKAFVWDSWEGMKPISNSVAFPQE